MPVYDFDLPYDTPYCYVAHANAKKKTQIEYRLPSALSKTRALYEHVHTHHQLKASTTLNSPYSAPIHAPKPTNKVSSII